MLFEILSLHSLLGVPDHLPRLSYFPAKEAEDRRVGLAKKQKLDTSAAPADAGASAATAQPAASSAGDVEMADAAREGAGGSSVEANGATDYAGQMTGEHAPGTCWPCVIA